MAVPLPTPDADCHDPFAELRELVGQPPPFGEAHVRVLDAAMHLMAERGYAAASLRELARRLQMSQPSLYHYFDSKEQLVEQIIRWHAAGALRAPHDAPQSPSLEEGLRLSLGRMLENYHSEEHVEFVRFLHLVSGERPEFRALARDLFYLRGLDLLERFTRIFVRLGEVREQDAAYLAEAAINALLMRLMGHQVLFGETRPPSDSDCFADFVVDALVRGARARRRQERP